VYYSHKDSKGKLIKKETHWHSDVNLDKDGLPESENSQLPGTPVVIFTFGDPKHLWFQKLITKKLPMPNTLCHIVQNNSCLFGWMEEMS
jgi:hypothetical protein